ncbi:hypothetical protein JRQ81_001848 [Phrynocephalus forsythii]|uniref:Uncharacterized protein n=1 Tax=Phrynocephalus forsythii TaxID=171643 RepID=A0A9Q0YDU4_9SAUR|nr:hypothetical protein JRQ81_001848 [Phrynocephalus forsythii]
MPGNFQLVGLHILQNAGNLPQLQNAWSSAGAKTDETLELMLLIVECTNKVLDIMKLPNNIFSVMQQKDTVSFIPMLMVAAWKACSPSPRFCWIYPSRSNWFHSVVLEYWDESLWIDNFRMSHQILF